MPEEKPYVNPLVAAALRGESPVFPMPEEEQGGASSAARDEAPKQSRPVVAKVDPVEKDHRRGGLLRRGR